MTNNRTPIPGANGGTLYPFRPGESGNPAGRKTAGACVREAINALAAKELSTDDLRQLANAGKTPAERIAASRLLNAVESREEAEFVCEQTDGRPRQTIQGLGGAPLFTGVQLLPPDEPPDPN